ncbi:MAG TPA: hypothetical protein VK495_11035 [Steroidobacteraceae bacterium]|nr:hypothetical protein [Steroidobacteraceae bacterium]
MPPSSAPQSSDITPTVTFDDAATPGLTTFHGELSDSSSPDPVFGFSGAVGSAVTQFGPAYPRFNMVSADTSNSDTYSPGTIYASFYHTGKTLDLIQYGASETVTVYIDDRFFARYGGALATGTAQGGSASGITLASSSSTVSGYYNEYYVRIAGGTGLLGEVRQIVSYDGTSRIADVAPPWSTMPDSTTLYVLQDGTQPFVLDGSTGSVKYIHLTWNQSGQRKITVEQGVFAGVAADGAIAAAPSWSTTPLIVVGDSFWDGTAAPINIPRLIDTFALGMGWLPTNLGQGGTGYISGSVGRLNFQDRIAPPSEAWRVARTATAGTYTIDVTFGGVTATSAAIAFNAGATSIEAALNVLPNISGAGASFSVARGDFATPLIFVGHGMPGATLSFDSSGLAGGAMTILGSYEGDLAPNVPMDSSGNALPFYLLVPGSGNDTHASTAQLQAAATYVAQQITAKFPTAIAIFTGVFGDCNAGTSIIGPTDISRNAAIAAAAAYLPKIGGKVPFIDTYANGLGGLKIINGLGTVAEPEPGTNSNLKSITAPGHPTGPGSQCMSDWLVAQVKALIG